MSDGKAANMARLAVTTGASKCSLAQHSMGLFFNTRSRAIGPNDAA
jgi:hypothetical protein